MKSAKAFKERLRIYIFDMSKIPNRAYYLDNKLKSEQDKIYTNLMSYYEQIENLNKI